MKPTTPRRLISIREFAVQNAISEKTVRRGIAAGRLPAYRVGSSIRLDACAAQAAMLQPMNAAAAELLAGGDVA